MVKEKGFKMGSKEYWDDIQKKVYERRKKLDLSKIETKETTVKAGINIPKMGVDIGTSITSDNPEIEKKIPFIFKLILVIIVLTLIYFILK